MGMKRTLSLILLFVAGTTASISAAEFVAKIVDGMGRPVSAVDVKVLWYKMVSEDSAQNIDSLILRSDSFGLAKGHYDENRIWSAKYTDIELKKEGYHGYNLGGLRRDFVRKQKFTLEKLFGPEDVRRVAKLTGERQINALKELLTGKVERYKGEDTSSVLEIGDILEELIFFYERQFRPALLSLAGDKRVGSTSMEILALIGFPADVRLIIQNHRPSYGIVSALLEPTTTEEWDFLKKCASGDYNDLWIDGGAINALKLIASTHSLEVLEETHKKNAYRKNEIDKAIKYIKSNPPPLADTNLVEAGNKVARAIKFGRWDGNGKPRYNLEGDKALIDCEFRSHRCLFVHNATFHKVDGVWKFRGERQTFQALLTLDQELKE